MRPETIKKLCCPFDKADLTLTEITKDLDENVLEGFFVCNSCKRLYPIIKSIPIMSPDEYREFKLEQPLLERWSKELKGQSFENFRLVSAEGGTV
ncbi:Trm112 family protein [Arcticibacterium luteifluviistationis]|uniref:Trm112 family protein n=1 Tax=Arcticibacterium luteifluviistationis TaxID=1784714 RepID=A0A2Z4G8D1_9BACT|nr:Trm112 family protein [Arcticibacterium luteifluviistationis]AWV97441.1 hypothetical protein DJ013_04350 [Arcticibacterium luteifluviistationis]